MFNTVCPSSAAEREAEGRRWSYLPCSGHCFSMILFLIIRLWRRHHLGLNAEDQYTGPDSDYVNKYYGSEGCDLSWSGGEEEEQDDNCPQWPRMKAGGWWWRCGSDGGGSSKQVAATRRTGRWEAASAAAAVNEGHQGGDARRSGDALTSGVALTSSEPW